MVTKAEILHIAKLANLQFADQKVDELIGQISNIMHMVETLKPLDCTGIAPLKSITNQSISLRSDQITDGNLQTELFSNVHGRYKDLSNQVKCFVVPKVIE